VFGTAARPCIQIGLGQRSRITGGVACLSAADHSPSGPHEVPLHSLALYLILIPSTGLDLWCASARSASASSTYLRKTVRSVWPISC